MKQVLARRLVSFPKGTGYVLSFFLFFVLLLAVTFSPRGKEITDRFYDVIRTTGERKEAVIIGIDDKSLAELGAWPWDRTVFADLAKVLSDAGVRVIVYDVLFFEPRTGDKQFKESLKVSSSTSILAAKYEKREYLSSYLVTSTGTNLLQGVANVVPDADGKVRRYPASFLHDGICTNSLSREAFDVFTFKKDTTCTFVEESFRYPKNITTYSLVDVLRGVVLPESLKGTVVFIGSTSLGLEDHFIGIYGYKIPGVYVHASSFVSLLNDIHDRPLRPFASGILLFFVSLISAMVIFRSRLVLVQIGSLIGILILVCVGGVVAFTKGIVIPLPWIFVASIVSAGLVTLVRIVNEKKQNELVQAIFSKFVHKDVLKELMRSGSEIKLGGEKKQLTVLFSDLRGFTALSESLTPEGLTSLLNGYFSAMTPHILEERGTIDKFIGDAIMAFWNAPLDVPGHSLHAVRSALRMHEALREFNKVNDTMLAIGVGVHTGNAIVGNVGGKDRVNYTILGDTVNLTSRLEGLTKKYGVSTIVTKAIVDAVDDPLIAFRCLDVITVLGKSIPTVLYEARYSKDFSNNLIKKYEKAFKAYYTGEWDKAESEFKKLAKEGDLPSEIMLMRIPLLRKRKEWDGIWRFEDK